MTSATQPRLPTEAEEGAITREVLRLLAELDHPKIRNGRIVPPAGASEELVERIRAVEGELLWALGKPTGPRWGCSWVPAVFELPVIKRKSKRKRIT